jgi:cysteinyl-tRNA synthetase
VIMKPKISVRVFCIFLLVFFVLAISPVSGQMEIASDGGMEAFVLVQNPAASPVHVNIKFQTDTGEQAPAALQGVEIPARSRRTFKVNDYVISYNVSTKVEATDGQVICERAMYGDNRTWAHDSIGVTSPAPTWYLAEGASDGGMEAFVLVQNPAASPVHVNIKFQTDTGEQAPAALQGVEIPARSRRTFKVNDYVISYNVSTKVEATDGQVICERAMYGDNRTWAHDSIGVTSPAPTWYLAEGATEGEITDDLLNLGEVQTWAYQIQDISETGAVAALAASSYDMLVVEPTRTDWSSDDKYFNTKGMVEQLKATMAGDGVHRKLVIAYIDIGEAEDWRWYWDWSYEWKEGDPRPADWPDYIVTHDPDGWEGNYPVTYWDPDWKDVIIYGQNTGTHPDRDYSSVLDEVLQDGFDGVYLDWVEGYEDVDVAAEAVNQGLDPAEEMAEFIKEIRDYGRSRNPDFVVIQQNAAALASERPETLSYIDAIAQEAIWYDGDAFDNWNEAGAADIPVGSGLTQYYLNHLNTYQAAGLPVFDCEYAVKYADQAYTLARNKGFIPYCTRRSLSRLTTTPPWSY